MGPTFTYTLDSFGNMTQTSDVKTVYSQLAFLSDVGYPQTVADSAGYYFVKYSEQIAPEQGKYSTILDLTPADPRLDELYEYIPTLRKSLRLSQAARCAPVFGGDYLIDDERMDHQDFRSCTGLTISAKRKFWRLNIPIPPPLILPEGQRNSTASTIIQVRSACLFRSLRWGNGNCVTVK